MANRIAPVTCHLTASVLWNAPTPHVITVFTYQILLMRYYCHGHKWQNGKRNLCMVIMLTGRKLKFYWCWCILTSKATSVFWYLGDAVQNYRRQTECKPDIISKSVQSSCWLDSGMFGWKLRRETADNSAKASPATC